jgi:DNA-binding XRE family transcriptional regulator
MLKVHAVFVRDSQSRIAGITQVGLSQGLGINQPTISAIEHGMAALRVEQLG